MGGGGRFLDQAGYLARRLLDLPRAHRDEEHLGVGGERLVRAQADLRVGAEVIDVQGLPDRPYQHVQLVGPQLVRVRLAQDGCDGEAQGPGDDVRGHRDVALLDLGERGVGDPRQICQGSLREVVLAAQPFDTGTGVISG